MIGESGWLPELVRAVLSRQVHENGFALRDFHAVVAVTVEQERQVWKCKLGFHGLLHIHPLVAGKVLVLSTLHKNLVFKINIKMNEQSSNWSGQAEDFCSVTINEEKFY